VTLALFIFVETRVKAPMVRMQYMGKPAFGGSLAVAFATYFGVFSIFFLTALYLQVVLGYTAYRTAALFVPMALGMIVASAIAGRWVAESGPRVPVTVGCFCAGAGVLWDSGRVRSDATTQVTYAGSPLASRQRVWWRAQRRDQWGRRRGRRRN